MIWIFAGLLTALVLIVFLARLPVHDPTGDPPEDGDTEGVSEA